MMDQFARRGEDEKAQPLGPRCQQLRRQRQPFERREHVEGEHRQPQPGSIGAEIFARHDAAGQLVLDHLMRGFDRSGLLAMLLKQFLPRPLPQVAGHREMLHRAAVGEQLALLFADADGHIAQRLVVTVL